MGQPGSTSCVLSSNILSMFSQYRQGSKEKSRIAQAVLQDLLASCLLTFHWPEQVPWPCPSSMGREIDSSLREELKSPSSKEVDSWRDDGSGPQRQSILCLLLCICTCVLAGVCESVCNVSVQHRCVCMWGYCVCTLSLNVYICATCIHAWAHSGSSSAHVSMWVWAFLGGCQV